MSAIPDMESLSARFVRGECRRRADAAVDEVSKIAWRAFAEEWVKLADEAELSTWRAPQK